MSHDTADKIIDNIFKSITGMSEITFGFQGGEPTLAGLSWFRHFVDYVTIRKGNISVRYTFQTNGLLLDESWCTFFRENNFLIGLSIDGGKRFHNRNRICSEDNGTYEICLRSKELLEKSGVEYNILCVLINDLAKEPEKVWHFIMNENIRYIQFIPCLEPLFSELHRADGNILRPMLFAQFYSRLLPLWIRELEKGNYVSVKFFDDIVNYFCKNIPTSCGIDGRCNNQCVIEADGSVYPCDFYAVDSYKLGNLSEMALHDIFIADKFHNFIMESPKLSKNCTLCHFFPKCRGGCKRMRNVMYAGATGTVCGFRSFLEKCLAPLEYTARKVFQ